MAETLQRPARARIPGLPDVHYLSREHHGETACGLRPALTHGLLAPTEDLATCRECRRVVEGSAA